MKTLLFTGGTGFLGKNVMPLLQEQYDVTTCGITPEDIIKANLAKDVPTLDKHYDIVLHACGKAHSVPKTEAEKQVFFDVNYQGTVNLCSALEKVGVPSALIFISTVAVYGCEAGELISEDHPLNGETPYAKSKIMAEEYLTKWCSEHGVVLGILRPSLLAGKNAPGNLGAMVNGVRKPSLLVQGALRLGLVAVPDYIIIGTIMCLIPGVGLTNAIRDLFTGDVITGILRSIEALLLTLAIAVGFALPTFLLGGGL